MREFLLIPHLYLQNANAMSSPYTIGFPAMTAWLGAMHALQRKLQAQNWPIQFNRLAVSSHHFDLQTYKGSGDFISSVIGTANPLDKEGNRPAFIEEARCHLEVSLLLEFDKSQFIDPDDYHEFFDCINQTLQNMKFASGDVIKTQSCQILKFNENDELHKQLTPILAQLMLGYVLVDRHDLIQQTMQEDNKDALEAILDYLKIYHIASSDDNGKINWSSQRKQPGWLIPIAVGFQGISELGIAKNQRDSNTPHRFAESVVTLGEFIMPMPSRIQHIDQILWQYHIDLSENLYLCQNSYTPLETFN